MKDTLGFTGWAIMTFGAACYSFPAALISGGVILIIWATIEDIRSDR